MANNQEKLSKELKQFNIELERFKMGNATYFSSPEIFEKWAQKNEVKFVKTHEHINIYQSI